MRLHAIGKPQCPNEGGSAGHSTHNWRRTGAAQLDSQPITGRVALTCPQPSSMPRLSKSRHSSSSRASAGASVIAPAKSSSMTRPSATRMLLARRSPCLTPKLWTLYKLTAPVKRMAARFNKVRHMAADRPGCLFAYPACYGDGISICLAAGAS